MSTKLYVGGLAYGTTEDELKDAFSQFGDVVEVTIITDRESGRSKGFGFVEMADEDGAKKAIDEQNGKELGGRKVNVSEARPKEDRGPRGGGTFRKSY